MQFQTKIWRNYNIFEVLRQMCMIASFFPPYFSCPFCTFSVFAFWPFSFIFCTLSRKWRPALFVLTLRAFIFTVFWPFSRLEASRYISSAMNRPWGGYSCFSICQISWIKIEKELFVNKRRDLVRVCLRFNWQCLGGSFFMILLEIQLETFFLPTNKHR